MAFKTINGFNPLGGAAPAVNSSGLFPISGHPTGEQFDNVHKDLLQALLYGSLAGVISGGVCTAATNIVTIPANTYYIAGGMVFYTDTTYTQAVADGTSYLWGCSDGTVQVTATTTPPTGFTTRTACIITKAVASGGVATVDNTVQERARTADATNRIVGESAKVFAPEVDTIPSGFVGVIEAGSQIALYDKFTNSGTLVCRGKIRVQG